jgi:DNA-3-methyladenine glycosylase I
VTAIAVHSANLIPTESRDIPRGAFRSYCLIQGSIRNRQKIAAAVGNARAFLAIQEEFGSFDAYSWRFVGGEPKVNRWRVTKQIPATSTESDALSKDLKGRGFRFVGSTVIYAHMQAVGMVNDHLVECFRYREVATDIVKPEG